MPRPKGKTQNRTPKHRYAQGTPSGMTKEKRVSLRYCQKVDISTTAGVLGSHVWRANSLYDPNYTDTVGDHQPMGFDNWADLYNHYTVESATIEAVWGVDSAIDNAYASGVYLTDVFTVPYTDHTEFKEAKKGTVKYCTGRSVTPMKTKSSFDATKFFNITDVKDNVARIGSLTTTNPTEGAFFVTWIQGLNASSEQFQCVVTIDFNVVFSEPKDLPQS